MTATTIAAGRQVYVTRTGGGSATAVNAAAEAEAAAAEATAALAAITIIVESLSALAALTGTGLIVRGGASTAFVRSIGVGTGLTISNADGTAGDPTINLNGILAGLSAVTTAADKVIYATGVDTFATADFTSVARTLVGQSTQALMRTTGLGMSANGSSLVSAADYTAMKVLLALTIGTDVQAYSAELAAIAANSTNGLWARTGAGTGAARTITGTANQIGVTNGDGVSGNPVLALLGNALAFAGLTGAADKLAYFTGAAAMAVTDLVSQARSFLADPSSAYVNFIHSATGAVATNQQTRGRKWVLLSDFGVAGVGGDDSAVWQLALNSGLSFLVPEGDYLCNNLTQTTGYQRVAALGIVRVIKNANGPILTSSADYVEWEGVNFRGENAVPVFTGDNIVFTGAGPRLIDCGSVWAYGRALKVAGGEVFIDGSNATYQTADTSATGYDIEIEGGLYHYIAGVKSGQSTGGILLNGTGSHTIVGGKVGKVTIKNTIAFPGANGGKFLGVRITGDVSIGMSNGCFTGCQFGGPNVVIEGTVTGTCLDASNNFQSGTVVTNLGNNSNVIIRQGLGPSGYLSLRYGDDTNYYDVSYALGEMRLGGALTLPNNVNIYQLDAGGTLRTLANMGPSGIQTFGDPGNNFTQIVGNSAIYMVDASGALALFDGTCLRPYYTDVYDLGTSAKRFAKGYINTPIIATATPATAGAAGEAGQIAWDASYIYVCVATDTWKRVAIATW